ncbi:UDP-glucoronosyl and UDP-glucosyl transferase [Ostertagia ostertagi]
MKKPAQWTAPPCTGLCLKWSDYQLMVEQTYRLCKALVDDDDMMHRLRESKFDLVYSEGLDTCGPVLLCVGSLESVHFQMLKIKNAVILCSLGMWPRLYDISGLLPSPSFVPIGLSPFSDELSFIERLINFNLHIFFEIYKKWLDGRFWRMFNEKAPGIPAIRDILYEKTALIMTNVHEFAETTRPRTNMIRYIGGSTIHDPQPLGKELSDVLNERPTTVLFCMGTVVYSKDMPEWMKRVFIETFASFPNITFLWKYEDPDDDIFKNLSNVHPMKWIPQTDLLGRRLVLPIFSAFASSALLLVFQFQRIIECRLFITHGGMNSILESMNFGKPMIVVPLFADQQMNSKAVQRRGLGVVIEKHLLSKDILSAAIQKVLHDKSIAKNCSLVKKLLTDRPRQYREDIAKYTRLIIEYGRLEHLQMISRNMSLIQYLCLDVIAFEICVMFFVLFLCVWSIRQILLYLRTPKIKNE